MASVSRANGFRPVKTITGANYNGQANLYFVPASDSTAIMVGDAVKLAGDARAAGRSVVVRRGRRLGRGVRGGGGRRPDQPDDPAVPR